MQFETPAELLARLKLGREETFQRLLTALILRAPYPRWNTRSAPSLQGVAFLRSLYELSFDAAWPGDDFMFVDEFDLPARHELEKGGAPDWVAVWDDHLWIIELKTEKGSHRRDQIPGYYELAHHYYPDCTIDQTYLTGPMKPPFDPSIFADRYAHLTWDDVAPLIRAAWPEPTDPGEAAVRDGVLHGIDHLHLKPVEWQAMLTAVPPEPPKVDPLDVALALAAETAADGAQRALDVVLPSLDALHELRLAVRERLATATDESLRHVMPWIWQHQSTGTPMTAAGTETGYELRLSRYEKPLY